MKSSVLCPARIYRKQ